MKVKLSLVTSGCCTSLCFFTPVIDITGIAIIVLSYYDSKPIGDNYNTREINEEMLTQLYLKNIYS